MYLSHFQTYLPAHHLSQSLILDWMKKVHRQFLGDKAISIERYIDHFSLSENQIRQRYFENEDIYLCEYPNEKNIEHRHQFYQKRAIEIFFGLFPLGEAQPHHLIHVTCTGYNAPSAPQILISERHWKEVEVTHAYHMGCYAALPALRMADALAHRQKKTIDIVHTEMCSLHMNPTRHEPEQLVVQSLFSDGHIRYQVSEYLSSGSGFEIVSIMEKILPDSSKEMTWTPAPWGLQMSLSKEVPRKLKEAIRSFYMELMEKAKLDGASMLKEAWFAIHPGGPKIIDVIREVLELSEEQIKLSKKVLYERGNMSSATLPHVWQEILTEAKPNTYIVSFAFGPGLTLFGSVFKVVG